MPIEFLVALISFAGVLISVIVAYLTSTRQSRIEAEKLQRIIYNDFSERIFEKRLELYLTLFEVLSNFEKKHIVPNQLTKRDFQGFLLTLQELDSKTSLLFSKQTGLIAYKFLEHITDLASKSDDELVILFTSNEQQKELKVKFYEYELALKSELGIYAFDNPVNIGAFTRYQRYGEITKSLRSE